MIKIDRLIFYNRAPFSNMSMCLDNQISILSGINGKGKSTILSYVADSFYELAKKAYRKEFGLDSSLYYRISSPIDCIDNQKPSIVYIRYRLDEKYVDYIDIHNELSLEEYDNTINLSDKIPIKNFISILRETQNVKYWSINDEHTIKNLFSNNILTFFPAYRFEIPAYLNYPYKNKLFFKTDADVDGYLPNPIDNNSTIQQVTNWMMDVVLDALNYNDISSKTILDQLNEMIQNILETKRGRKIRFGIGPRHNTVTRLAVVNDDDKSYVCPNIFYMSSGELQLFGLFGELLRQTDKIKKQNDTVQGIVLIDEVDKHLHISLQKEILPKLFEMFPNIQFIITSHSPFFEIGLDDEKLKHDTFDLDHNGLCSPTTSTDVFKEAYNVFIEHNNQFVNKYFELEKQIKKDTKPLIMTEWKTDISHLKLAMDMKGIDMDLDFISLDGDKNLKSCIDQLQKISINKKIIAVFDRDNDNVLNAEYSNKKISNEKYVKVSKNIYAFAIPLVNNEYGSKISIEHYYNRDALMQCNENNQRLFCGDEFYHSLNSKDGNYQTIKDNEHLIDKNGIIDSAVFAKTDLEHKNNIALSKEDFTKIIEKHKNTVCFDNFEIIFNIIQKIIDEPI